MEFKENINLKLEEQFKELIKPYIDIEKYGHITEREITRISNELLKKGYSIAHLRSILGEYEEYNIQSIVSREKDYFRVNTNYIGEIVRNIKR